MGGFQKEVEKIDSMIYRLEKSIETLKNSLYKFE